MTITIKTFKQDYTHTHTRTQTKIKREGWGVCVCACYICGCKKLTISPHKDVNARLNFWTNIWSSKETLTHERKKKKERKSKQERRTSSTAIDTRCSLQSEPKTCRRRWESSPSSPWELITSPVAAAPRIGRWAWNCWRHKHTWSILPPWLAAGLWMPLATTLHWKGCKTPADWLPPTPSICQG